MKNLNCSYFCCLEFHWGLDRLNHLMFFRSVSQELSETILTMAANCNNVMNKARQPPPGVMPKGRAPSTSSLDAISPVQVRCCNSSTRFFFESWIIKNNHIILNKVRTIFSFWLKICERMPTTHFTYGTKESDWQPVITDVIHDEVRLFWCVFTLKVCREKHG